MTKNANKKHIKNRGIYNNLLKSLIIILLLLGVFFRLVNLDRKIYYGDEIYTSLRISGYTYLEMNQELRNGSVVSPKDLQKYQFPNREKNVVNTINGLALEESQVTPLYFILARFWVQWFGNSITVTRSFSAFISLLAFPGIYLLCKELFASPLIGWIAMALIAVSPAHVIYAQVARFYSLWILLILLSSVALLRSIRVKTKISWGIYSVTVALGLYTQLFFGLVAIGQGIYVAVIEHFRFSRTLISYLLASLVGLITFFPWILLIFTSPNPETVSWTQTQQTRLTIAIRWAGIVSRTFLDIGMSPSSTLILKLALAPLILIVLALIVYSIYFICRSNPKRVWLFILTLISSVGLPLILEDLIFQKRYGTTRYILPSILGIHLAVAYLISTKLKDNSSQLRQKNPWIILASMLTLMGVISCTISSQSEIWWNNSPEKNQYILPASSLVNKSPQPLVISDEELIDIQILGYRLEPKVRLLLVEKPNIPDIPRGFNDVFLFEASESLRAGLSKKYNTQIKQIYPPLWKLQHHTIAGRAGVFTNPVPETESR
ncbi:glycosyltransferase family 39 protein [Coleofasciculus sp. F4-SAH-05]|uniref:glycosyltransferase family 39 protein n=1 Tax=Coleofasciculus TaxID=669368 RepID=UPI0032FCC09E